MPKLNAQLAGQVDQQEASSFEALPAGTYTVRLMDVEARMSANGNQVWSWTYEILDEPHRGRRLWDTTALTEKALWRLKAVFDAFGATPDIGTDDLSGQKHASQYHHERIKVAGLLLRSIKPHDGAGIIAEVLQRGGLFWGHPIKRGYVWGNLHRFGSLKNVTLRYSFLEC